MFSVCVMKHLLERGVIVIHILEEPLLGELLLGQGLCEGLDVSLLDVVGVGLITCVEVGFVRRPISLLAEYTVLLLILMGQKGSRNCGRLKENQEKRKLDGMESSKSKSDAHFMHGLRETRAQLEPRCGVQIMTTGT